MKGLVEGELPPVGNRVDLNGKVPRDCGPVATTPDEVASAQERVETEKPAESTPEKPCESTTPGVSEENGKAEVVSEEAPAAAASVAVLTKVEFKQQRKPRSGDDEKGKDEPKGSDDKPSDDDKGGEKR